MGEIETMANRTYSLREKAEIVGRVETAITNGTAAALAATEAGIDYQTYKRWSKRLSTKNIRARKNARRTVERSMVTEAAVELESLAAASVRALTSKVGSFLKELSTEGRTITTADIEQARAVLGLIDGLLTPEVEPTLLPVNVSLYGNGRDTVNA